MSEESLFLLQEDWQYNACVAPTRDRHFVMAHGYRMAAQRLCESLSESQMGLDFLIYPIVFLYRHWFELRLKHIIDQGRQLLREPADFPKVHDLDPLWNLAEPILKKVWPGNEPEEFRLIKAAVRDFQKFDGTNAQSFRYPFGRKKEEQLIGLKHINIRHFQAQMEQMAELLDGASEGITSYLHEMYSSSEGS